MWHPMAIDTFDIYFQSRSIFSDIMTDEGWTTSITLVCWFLISPSRHPDRDIKEEKDSRFAEDIRYRGVFPPPAVRKLKGIQADADSWNIEERSTALVMTGSPDGHMWICSLWSQLIDDEEELREEVGEVYDILDMFKNQPRAGRILAFIYLLGTLCLDLHNMQAKILGKLEKYTGMGTRVFLDGYDWEADDAVDRLRSMMWGLESLRMLGDRASASLKSINEARATLIGRLDQERDRWHPILRQEYDRIVERFDKQREQLVILHDSFDLKILQVTGLRDGLSTVTNVQDSHTSVKQNSSEASPK